MADIAYQADSTTLILNGDTIDDFLDGDIITLTPVNPLTERTNGSKNSVGIHNRSDGGVHDLVVRVFKYSPSDILFNNAVNQVAPVVFEGSMKENYKKDGVASVSSHLLEGGSITTLPTEVKNNQEGNDLMEYTLQFRNASRAL